MSLRVTNRENGSVWFSETPQEDIESMADHLGIETIDVYGRLAAGPVQGSFRIIETDTEYERFIVIAMGYWGAGQDISQAKMNFRKAGGRAKEAFIYRFRSPLPFAPTYRDAIDNEADCYVDRSGMMHWIRCHREELE